MGERINKKKAGLGIGLGSWFLGVHGKGQHGVWLWEDNEVLGRKEGVLHLRGRGYCYGTPEMGNRSDTPCIQLSSRTRFG